MLGSLAFSAPECGARYLVQILLRIDPVYRADLLGTMTLNRWNFFVEGVTVEVAKLDYSKRSKGSVRYIVKVTESVRACNSYSR